MKIKRFAAVLLALAVCFGAQPASHAQDTTVQATMYFGRDGLIKTQSGGGVELNRRTRFTIAQVNAGATLLPAIQSYRYRLIDLHMIAVGGAVITCTSVDINATQATSAAVLVANAVAALTQSAVLRAGATNSVVLADGASFAQNDLGTAITVGKVGGTCATATHVDVNITYSIEQ